MNKQDSLGARTFIVALGEKATPIGRLQHSAIRHKEATTFWYDPAWLSSPSAFALTPSMPLQPHPFHFAGVQGANDQRASLPPALRDATPDAWGRSVIQRAAGRACAEIDFLTRVNDHTRQGALRIIDDRGNPLSTDHPPIPRLVDLPKLRALTAKLQAGEGNLKEIALEIQGATASLGGARPKAMAQDDKGHLFLAKFTTASDGLPIERVEVATLRLAQSVGINAANATLALPRTRWPIALIERFDRAPHPAAEMRRLHYLSAHSFMDAEGAGQGIAYTDVVDQLMGCSTPQAVVDAQARELHRRILFSILVSNTDDHLKNHGFLLSAGGYWQLSPAFDVNPQPERTKQLKTAISHDTGHQPTIDAWLHASPRFGVKEDEAKEQAARMATAIRGTWRQALRRQGVTPPLIKAYVPAFEHTEAEKAIGLANVRVAISGKAEQRAKHEAEGSVD